MPQTWNEMHFVKYDWLEFYRNTKEVIPPNAPPLQGMEVQMNAFIDVDHVGKRIIRRSHTGILLYLNSAPIQWYSKAQATVETSTFGSEFIVLRTAVEMIEAMR